MCTSRYEALGLDLPDVETVCQGECEGTGSVPIHRSEEDPLFKKLWDEAEAKKPTNDNYHFVVCPACDGSGKRNDTLHR